MNTVMMIVLALLWLAVLALVAWVLARPRRDDEMDKRLAEFYRDRDRQRSQAERSDGQ